MITPWKFWLRFGDVMQRQCVPVTSCRPDGTRWTSAHDMSFHLMTWFLHLLSAELKEQEYSLLVLQTNRNKTKCTVHIGLSSQKNSLLWLLNYSMFTNTRRVCDCTYVVSMYSCRRSWLHKDIISFYISQEWRGRLLLGRGRVLSIFLLTLIIIQYYYHLLTYFVTLPLDNAKGCWYFSPLGVGLWQGRTKAGLSYFVSLGWGERTS